jgi:hypothetical protein
VRRGPPSRGRPRRRAALGAIHDIEYATFEVRRLRAGAPRCAEVPPAAVVRGVAPRWEAIHDIEFEAFEVRRSRTSAPRCAEVPPAAVVRGVAPRWEAIHDIEFEAFEVRRSRTSAPRVGRASGPRRLRVQGVVGPARRIATGASPAAWRS